jgi:putative thioredoxin
MNNLENITDVTADTFNTQVIERSHNIPVLVDFWADWCGPCQMQMPMLKKLVDDYHGKFALAKVNTDEQRELARTFNIRSLPTMHLYKNGEIVEEILAAQTESDMRILLERHIERKSDAIRLKAREAWQQGDSAQAFTLLREARQAEPDNHHVTLDYIELSVKEGLTDQAEALLADLPHDIRNETEAVRLRSLLDFTITALQAAPLQELETTVREHPDNLESRYQLASRYVLEDRLEEAMDAFMVILQQDRAFRDDAGRRGLLAVFELLGNEGELVNSYRRKLFNALH